MWTNDAVMVYRYRELLRNLVLRDLRMKYKGSALGFFWSLLHPLAMAVVYTIAFEHILKIDIDFFPLFLLSGLLPWMFFAQAISAATGAVADNGNLVRKVAFPRVVLPMGAIGAQFVQFLLMYLVVFPLALVIGVGLSPALFALVPVILLQMLFTVGFGLALSTAYVYLRDTRHLLEVVLQVWFWLTPVLYAVWLAPEDLRPVLWLNPMTHFVTAYQQIVVYHRAPGVLSMTIMTVVALAVLGLGMAIFSRHQRRFAEFV
jgi:ABC-type polysaccharide/polyol phosphate export permease